MKKKTSLSQRKEKKRIDNNKRLKKFNKKNNIELNIQEKETGSKRKNRNLFDNNEKLYLTVCKQTE